MDADGKVHGAARRSRRREAARSLLARAARRRHPLPAQLHQSGAREARAEIVRGLWPNPYVTAGHAILSEYREFERGVTAGGQRLGPAGAGALSRAPARGARRQGLRPRHLVMQGNGGTISSR
jgi:N-methylhydantoinase A